MSKIFSTAKALAGRWVLIPDDLERFWTGFLLTAFR